MTLSKIIWTKTDEAPALASFALLPVVRAYLKHADIEIDEYDISLAGRILASFPEYLDKTHQVPDHLSELGRLVTQAGTNIIKLPNISASIPQLTAAVKELQKKGYAIPDYPESEQSAEQKAIKEQFAKVLGSAVNPVLREGNSDRRAAASVKSYALKNPHKMMKPWPEKGSKARVAHMADKDFFGSETSVTVEKSCTVSIVFQSPDGTAQVLRSGIELTPGEIIDSSVMNITALKDFYAEQIDAARKNDLLLSLHLKATMMKVSDPIMFGHCVSVFFKDLMEKHKETFEKISVNLNNGLADILDKINTLSPHEQEIILKDLQTVYDNQPKLAMVDSDKGITNLHVPNNVIIDASMPNVIRDGGKMWSPEGKLQETIALIPDRSYATIYQKVIEDCQANGQFDPAAMGSVSNIGLMAKKAEEYGSHDKTFEAPGNGTIQVTDDQGTPLMVQTVEKGDIFRMCQTKDVAVRDWVKLGISRARASNSPAVFWLNPDRGHDAELLKKLDTYLPEHDTSDVDIRMMAPDDAMVFTLARVRKSQDTIAVTGNVLRDYLTDLFPILELGTSSRMLSIVPLLEGGGLFETGAGGSAPKHVQQFLDEGHLRWDSLGEYCALVPSLEQAAAADGNLKAAVFAKALDQAIGRYLEKGKSPSRKTGEIDNRGSSFYIALFWAQGLAQQSDDEDIRQRFASIADQLEAGEARINEELLSAQGRPVNLPGYFLPEPEETKQQMRPSRTFNAIIDQF